jgi:hypothetical protein
MRIVDWIFGYAERVPGWLWLVVLIGPLLAMLVFHLSLGIRRRAMWERTAVMLGYVHRDEDTNLANTFNSLASFADVGGFETRSLDVLSKEENGVQTWLFDHASRKPRKFRTVCVIRACELQVPHFRLLQTGCLLGQGEAWVSFQDDPDFSKTFVLTTDNPAAIKRLFDPELRQHFLRIYRRCRELEKSNTDWYEILMLRLSNSIGRFEMEGAGDTLSVHLSRIIDPSGAPELLALTSETLQVLKGKQGEVSQQ